MHRYVSTSGVCGTVSERRELLEASRVNMEKALKSDKRLYEYFVFHYIPDIGNLMKHADEKTDNVKNVQLLSKLVEGDNHTHGSFMWCLISVINQEYYN